MGDCGSDRSGDEPETQHLPRRHARRGVSLADDAGAASRQLCLREAAEPHRRLAGSAAPDGAGVAADDDACRHATARLRDAATDSPERRGPGRVRPGHGRRLEGEEPACSSSACRWSTRSTSCPTPRRCGWSSPARSSRCSTSGRCAPASTRRKRSTWPRWTRSRRCKSVHPQLGEFLGPPCVLRNGIVAPRCTEGTHFCGVPVWQSFPEAQRRL